MNYVSTKRVSCLMIVRLNNFRSVRAAYGEEVAQGAMNHLRARIAPQFATMAISQIAQDEIELVVGEIMPDPLPIDMVVDALCQSLGAEPYRCGDDEIVLSISAGCGVLRDNLSSEDTHEQGRVAARAQLNASSCKPDSFVQWGAAWENLYRADMVDAVRLLKQVYASETFFSWQSVRKVADLATILHYEGRLCRIGDRGQRIDCDEAYKALERLELVHIVDQYLVSRVLDELDADPQARISVPVSAQSLSFNLHGKGAGWTELRTRLANDRSLARRLVIEVAETSPLPSLSDAQDFVAELRQLGAYIALSRFGAGYASVGQLLSLAPDMIKLDSAFLRTAFQSDRHRARIGHLVGLARTIGRVVIVDGVDLRPASRSGRRAGRGMGGGHAYGQSQPDPRLVRRRRPRAARAAHRERAVDRDGRADRQDREARNGQSHRASGHPRRLMPRPAPQALSAPVHRGPP